MSALVLLDEVESTQRPRFPRVPGGGVIARQWQRMRRGRREFNVEVVEVAAPSQRKLEKVKSLPTGQEVVAGGVARTSAQAVIHPIDTLKVRMQYREVGKKVLESAHTKFHLRALDHAKTLYKGCGSAAGGAGIAMSAYFAFYSVATNALQEHTDMSVSTVALVAGGFAAFGSAFVKVPLALTIRSVQAGVYKNPLAAGRAVVAASGVRGLFTGLTPTVLEDIPDMAFKFAAYETMRTLHTQWTGKARNEASAHEDLLMGGAAGAAAAAATTPFDVVKTRMMVTAAKQPTVARSALHVYRSSGLGGFFLGVGPRTLANGINSALFFCLFEAYRAALQAHNLREFARRTPPASHQPAAAPVSGPSDQRAPAPRPRGPFMHFSRLAERCQPRSTS